MNALARQEIPIVCDEPVSDAVTRLLDVLTTARLMHAQLAPFVGNGIYVSPPLTIFTDLQPDAEYAAKLFASVQTFGITIDEKVNRYTDGKQIRIMRLRDSNGEFACIQHPIEDQPPRTDVDVNQMWRPTDKGQS